MNQPPISSFSAFRHRFRLSAFSLQYFASRLRRYFYSGWVFLIPYLAAYLLYYVLKWPVNPASSQGGVPAASGQPSAVSSLWSVVPHLLHVYWAFHAINVGLAAWALIQWSREQKATALPTTNAHESTRIDPLDAQTDGTPAAHESIACKQAPTSAFSLQLSALRGALQRLAPWLLLALLFYIPGVYLEWPADPWEHLRRINEWQIAHIVADHSTWTKSSYFLTYSFVGWISPPTRQLFWLDFYYTGVCLLLCWQYYRLARAIGLGERASMLFVILQSVLFGNNIFGFYRYYGISSSIFAQLGAVALTRIAIELASAKLQIPNSKFQGNPAETLQEETKGTEKAESGKAKDENPEPRVLNPEVPNGYSSTRTEYPQPTVSAQPKLGIPTAHGVHFSAFSFQLSAFASALALLALIAFNHRQGLGIAGLGLLAVAIWRLVEWKRSMIWWLAGVALALSVIAILCFPRPAVFTTFVRDGWLTPWYGFNLFAFGLPVGDRTLQIVGIIGLVNLAASLLLVRRNSLVGWLTITPVLALCMPFVAIPFASTLAQRGGPENIITFQRMLFSIPAGLSLIWTFECTDIKSRDRRFKLMVYSAQNPQWEPAVTDAKFIEDETSMDIIDMHTAHTDIAWIRAHAGGTDQAVAAFGFQRSPFLLSVFAFPLLLLTLATLVLVPAKGPCYNHLWHLFTVPPNDLQLKPIILAADPVLIRLHTVRHLRLVTTAALGFLFETISPQHSRSNERSIGRPAVESLNNTVAVPISAWPTTASSFPTLTPDPLAADPRAWTTFNGAPPEFVAGIKDFRASSTALQNPPGRRSDVFTSDPIPIDPTKNYCIEISARQSAVTDAIAYLAVAWYDVRHHLLVSNVSAPAGANSPTGWANGTYSYFGLVGVKAPTIWTTFRTSFGSDGRAAIPPHGKFVRVGAILNYNETPDATIQFTNVRIWQKSATEIMADGAFSSDEHLYVIAPSSRVVWTFGSQAGQASTHWPSQQVATEIAGGAELISAAHAAGATPVGSGGIMFELSENVRSETLNR